MKKLHWDSIKLKNNMIHLAVVSYAPRERFSSHSHDFCELMFIRSGTGRHVINSTTHELAPGYLACIRPDDVHSIASGEAGMELINCAFQTNDAVYLEDRYFPGESSYFSRTSHLPFSILIQGKMYNEMQRLLMKAAGIQHTLFTFEHLFMNIYELIRRPFTGTVVHGAPEWLSRACEQIQQPENLKLGLSKFVDIAAHSREHVAREMKKITGKTPVEFINELKLKKAAGLLCTTDMTIMDISLECGFNNISWFHKTFKSFFSISPLQYRKQSMTAAI